MTRFRKSKEGQGFFFVNKEAKRLLSFGPRWFQRRGPKRTEKAASFFNLL
jgi:hypothetical protein